MVALGPGLWPSVIVVDAEGKYFADFFEKLSFYLCSTGFVYYSTVEEAKQVVNSSDDIELDGHVLCIDFAIKGKCT